MFSTGSQEWLGSHGGCGLDEIYETSLMPHLFVIKKF